MNLCGSASLGLGRSQYKKGEAPRSEHFAFAISPAVEIERRLDQSNNAVS
jgi:hypothetical protein